MVRRTPFALLLLVGAGLATSATPARDLSFDERVQAQEAIERVYYAHHIGGTRPFDEAVSRAVLEGKVRKYLEQSAALERFWHTPITAAMLERETERMVRGTMMPERLGELFAALGDDPFLIQECLARPILADRLARNFFGHGEWLDPSEFGGRLDIAGVRAVAGVDAQRPDRLPHTAGCVPDDTWDNGRLDDVPVGRTGHTEVWTGTELVIWGGGISSSTPVNTGDRYDPLTDTWARTSTDGAPPPMANAGAAWTGQEMIVWGPEGRGGRYDPVSDTWRPVSTVDGVPGQPLAWTGREMIVGHGLYDPQVDTWRTMSTVNAVTGGPRVWTGQRLLAWNSGALVGQYDPSTDTWVTLSAAGAPPSTYNPLAVWTGSEMVVWGGSNPSGFGANTGGRYNPTTNTWRPTSTVDAPTWATHEAVWTGQEMVVWASRSGHRYDPAADRWRSVSEHDAPSDRQSFTTVWTGEAMIVWGGHDFVGPVDTFVIKNSGGRYDPVADSWTPTSSQGPPRAYHTAVWTGSKMLVWGGWSHQEDRYLNSGNAYDPATDSWTAIANQGAPAPRALHAAVWTGSQMIVWGGRDFARAYFNTGGCYDPVLDRWTPTSVEGAPSPRIGMTTAWTGEEMIVWGGAEYPYFTINTGARYDPAIDRWSPTSTEGAPRLSGQAAVWTGREVIVWGGGTEAGLLNVGARYDPRADRWASVATEGAPAPRAGATFVWTGTEMVVWGGDEYEPAFVSLNTGGRYDPATDTWSPTSTLEAPTARDRHTAIWTGREMVVWGGGSGSSYVVFDTGGRYDPATDRWTPTSMVQTPAAREEHSAVWTGRSMIVFGGSRFNDGGRYFIDDSTDNDGDGLSECAGDCNDGLASVFPGAPEICDGLDQDCNGAIDDQDADTDGFSICEDCDDSDPSVHAGPGEVTALGFSGDKITLSWNSMESGASETIGYDVVKGLVADLPVGSEGSETCLAWGLSDTWAEVPDQPAPGTGYWYLVRARGLCSGTYGESSPGYPRLTAACDP